MPFIPVKREWTSKPPVGTPLRTDGHWSVRGLAGAWAFNEGSGKTAMGAPQEPSTCTAGASLTNAGLETSSNGYLSCPDPSSRFDNTQYSVVVGCNLTAINSWCQVWEKVSGGLPGYGLQEWAAGSGLFMMAHSENNYFSTFHKNLLLGKNATPSIVYNGSTVSAYVDGKFIETISVSAPRTGVGDFRIGNGYDTSYGVTGAYHYALVYNRALTPEEVRSISANPWQIFEPETVWTSTGTTTATLTQYSYRFLNDDGSESTATFAGDLNTAITLSPGDIRRLRILLDATGDPTGKQFQLEFRRKPSGGSFGDWTKIT